jgi:hypothetical protein
MKKIIFLSIAIILIAGGTTSAAGPVVINEIMYDLAKEDCVADGSDDTHEWIEIKNISGMPLI